MASKDRREGRDGGKNRRASFSIEQGTDGRLHLDVDFPSPPLEETDKMRLNPNWTFLSPLTLRAVKVLCGSAWMTKERIAEALGERPEGKLQSLLADLAMRGILESSTSKGYHLGIPEDAEPQAYRKSLMVWLNEQEALSTPAAPQQAAE